MDPEPKKIVKRKTDDFAVAKNLLVEIRDELAIEREQKLRNSLILATAIVMFAVPLNFMVEVSANYLDSSSTGDLEFFDYLSAFYWLFFFCAIFIIVAFTTFFKPMTRIFMESFDWDTAFKDLEETGKDYDEYHIDPGMTILCKICDQDFESYRGWERHKEACRSENLKLWQKWEKENEEMPEV